jgi:hypothetical protein
MKPTIYVLQMATILYLIGICSSCKKNDYQMKNLSSENKIEIALTNSFPKKKLEKKGIYLWRSWHIADDPQGNIYVSDQRINRVLKFSLEGKFLNRFGRGGQGPGDMNGPSDLIATEDQIIINEKDRIQFLDREGNYLHSFKTFKGYHKIALYKNYIYALSIIMDPEMDLVDVLSKEGEILFSFGECFKFKKELFPLNLCNLVINNNTLYIAFKHFPIVRKYSLQGELLEELRINNNVMKDREKKNLKAYKTSLRGKKVGFFPVINNICVTENSFFLLHLQQTIEITEFGHDGDLLAIYWCPRPEKYDSEDFIVREVDDSILFYLLQFMPDKKIDIFRPKKILNERG